MTRWVADGLKFTRVRVPVAVSWHGKFLTALCCLHSHLAVLVSAKAGKQSGRTRLRPKIRRFQDHATRTMAACSWHCNFGSCLTEDRGIEIASPDGPNGLGQTIYL